MIYRLCVAMGYNPTSNNLVRYCGMTVDEAKTLPTDLDGKTCYFCSEHCRQKFLSQLATAEHEKFPQGNGLYTCPMHPEVEQDHPGDCSKCGMAMEPMKATGEEANVLAAQKALAHHSRCNRTARRGEYTAAMETKSFE